MRHLSFIKKVVCLIFCFTVLFGIVAAPLLNTSAAEEASNDDKFYVNKKSQLNALFNTTVEDVKDPIDWYTNKTSFIVVREYEHNKTTRYKVYVNTPNIPQYGQNLLLRLIDDGYDNQMFTPQDNLVSHIGENSNVMTKFGFKIPVNVYKGEYPKIYMSLNGVFPLNFFEKIWRGLKALVGLSFTSPPDSTNYRSLGYYNHKYKDNSNEYLIWLIQNYYIKYFVKKLIRDESRSEYFVNEPDFINSIVTEEQYEAAKTQRDENKAKAMEAMEAQNKINEWWDKWSTEQEVKENSEEYKADEERAWQEYKDSHPEDQTGLNYTSPLNWKDYQPEEPPPLTDEQIEALTKYNEALAIIAKYEAFKELWYKGKDKEGANKKEIMGYSRCLLNTDDDKCTKEFKDQTVHASVMNVYATSGLYKATVENSSVLPSGTSGGSSGGDTADLTGFDGIEISPKDIVEAKKIFSALTTIGIPKQNIAGILGNISIECGGIDPTTIEGVFGEPYSVNGAKKQAALNDLNAHTNNLLNIYDADPTKSVDRSAYVSNGKYYCHLGLFSSTGPGAEALLKFARKAYKNWHTTELQMSFMLTPPANGGGSNMDFNKYKVPHRSASDAAMYFLYAHEMGRGDRCFTGTGYDMDTVKNYAAGMPDWTNVEGRKAYAEAWFHVMNSGWAVDAAIANRILDTARNYGATGGALNLQYKERLTRQEAIKIIQQIQDICGPAYEEVMGNITTLICTFYESDKGKKIKRYEDIDPRVMPYDLDTLSVAQDKKDVTVADPRVTRYVNSELVGGLVTYGNFNLIPWLLNPVKLYRPVINFTGTLSKLAVFFDQISNFDWIDKHKLQPTKMWVAFPAAMFGGFLLIILIVQLVQLTFRFFKGNAGIMQILGRFIGAVFMVGIIVLMATNGNGLYKTIKNGYSAVMKFGEKSVLSTFDTDGQVIQNLYGDKDSESVAYYIPYFNLWTRYNTGYSLTDPEQLINLHDPEAEGLSSRLTEIGSKPTNVWSVVLADSFNTEGLNIDTVDRKNGDKVNGNAYRVVDHFLAPRLSSTNPRNEALGITNTVNPNDNGAFQKMDIFTLFSGVITMINMLIVSLVKMLTFFWFWFQLFTLAFNIVLSKVDKHGNTKALLIKTFSPILFIFGIGIYSGLIVQLSLFLSGLIGLIVNLLALAATFLLLNAWSRRKNIFPPLLKPIVALSHPYLSLLSIKQGINDVELSYHAGTYGIERDEDTGRFNYQDFITEDGEFREDYIGNDVLREQFNDDLLNTYNRGRQTELSSAELMYMQKHLAQPTAMGATSMKEYNKMLKKQKKHPSAPKNTQENE